MGRKMMKKIIDLFREPEQRKYGTEYCVVCHRLVDIPKDTPVDQRKNYYEGVGQICDRCWNMIYGSDADTRYG